MDKKNLRPQATQPVNHLTIQYLSVELVELSEEALSQISGGSGFVVGPTPPVCSGFVVGPTPAVCSGFVVGPTPPVSYPFVIGPTRPVSYPFVIGPV